MGKLNQPNCFIKTVFNPKFSLRKVIESQRNLIFRTKFRYMIYIFHSAITKPITATYMYVSSISTMPASLNIQPCSSYFNLKNQVKKVLLKKKIEQSISVYTKMNEEYCSTYIALYHIKELFQIGRCPKSKVQRKK